MAMLGNADGAEAEIEAGTDLAGQSSYPGGRVWCQVASALNKIAQGDLAAARDAAASLADTVNEVQGNRFWSEIGNWWIDPDDSTWPSDTTGWLGGRDEARSRWLAVLRTARQGATGTGN
jgi:hypothetical protein